MLTAFNKTRTGIYFVKITQKNSEHHSVYRVLSFWFADVALCVMTLEVNELILELRCTEYYP